MNWTPLIAAAIAGIFGGGGLAALWKIRPESGRISVNAAEGAVIVQTGVISALREELTRATERIAILEKESGAIAELRLSIADLRWQLQKVTEERDELKVENSGLLARVARAETRIGELERHQNGGS